jgi:hypothetical protein
MQTINKHFLNFGFFGQGEKVADFHHNVENGASVA